MFESLKATLARWRTMDEVARMDPRDRMDLGLGAGELEEIVRFPSDVPERMTRMAAIHGLTPAELRADRTAYLDTLEACGHCGERKRCGRALADPEGARPEEMEFCPNHPAYDEMAAR
jgi:hypothetical protein